MQNSSNSNSPEPEINELVKISEFQYFNLKNISMGDKFRTIVKMLTLKLKSMSQKCENMSKILFHVDQ